LSQVEVNYQVKSVAVCEESIQGAVPIYNPNIQPNLIMLQNEEKTFIVKLFRHDDEAETA
jgi:hypothetical protein